MLRFLKRLLALPTSAAGRGRAGAGRWEGEEHFARLVAGVRDYAVFLLDRQGNVRTWNAGAERAKGYAAGEIVGRHFSTFYPPEAVSSGWPAHELDVAAATGRFEDEGWRVRKDGTRFWANVVITVLRDDAGALRGFLKITRDLTDRKQQEEKLRLSEERFRLMVEGVRDYAIFMLDPEGRVATWNAGAERLKGYAAAEIIGRHFSAFYPPDAVERDWPDEELRRAVADGRFEDEGWRVRKDGTRFWANVVITALRDDAGVLRGFGKVTRDLTERRAAEESARRLAAEEAARLAAEAAAREVGRQREQLRVTLESIGDAVVVTDAAGAVTFLNPAAAGLTGWNSADAAGRPLDEVFRIVREGTREPVESPVAAVFRENRVVELANHTVLVARDGREVPIEDSAAPIPGDGGAVGGAVLVFRDVTGRKRHDAALRVSESKFRELADAMPQVVYVLPRDGAPEYVNRRWYEYTGLPEEEPFDFAPVIHPDDLPALLKAGQEGRAAGRGFEAEFRLRRHDGEYRWFLTRSVPAGDDGSGRPARWYGTSTDIHDLKRAEEDLRDARTRLEAALDASAIATWAWEIEADRVTADRNLAALFGVSADEAAAGPLAAYTRSIHPDDRAATAAAIGAAVAAGGLYEKDFRVVRPDGAVRRVIARGRVELDGAGRAVRMPGVVVDVTERVEAQERLREEHRAVETLLAVGTRLAAELDPDRLIQAVTDETTALTGAAFGAFFYNATDDRGDVLQLYTLSGAPRAAFERFPPPRATAVFEPTFKGTGTIRLADVTADPRYGQNPPFHGMPDGHLPVRSYLAVPVKSRSGEVLGGLFFGHPEPGRFTARHERLAEGVAAQAAVAIDNARLYEAARRERDRAGRRERDARFLADASAALAALVDDESTLQTVARLAVPHFADWCAVDLLDGGGLRRVAVAHTDPAKVELAHDLHRRFPPEPGAPQGVWEVARTGRSALVPEITDDMLAASVKDPEYLRLLRELGLRSYIAAPLAARGKVLGVVTFIAAEGGRRYGPEDLAVAEDLAARAAVALDNARLYAEVRDQDRRKDEFLAMLAHELRNPLAPVRNGLQLLRMRGDPATVERAREMMDRQVTHLVRMVDDLMDLSRVMRGKVALQRESLDLAAVVHRAVETAQPALDAGGHELVVALPEEPVLVSGDVVRLTQVLSNLLVNAAKYSDRAGRVTVSVGREGAEAVVRVRDTGVGLAREDLSRIFDLFAQVDRSVEKSQGGLGIGLTLVKRLTEMHGGGVEARSEGPGRGSEFTVRLPLLRTQPRGPEPESRLPPAPERPQGRRVLVVDDNVDAAESLAILLEFAGHEVRAAHDGPSGLAAAAEFRPDLIVLDIGMPGMTGYEVARRLRADPETRGAVLVAVTGWGQEEDRRRSREAGFDHHLTKPVDPREILHLLAAPAHR